MFNTKPHPVENVESINDDASVSMVIVLGSVGGCCCVIMVILQVVSTSLYFVVVCLLLFVFCILPYSVHVSVIWRAQFLLSALPRNSIVNTSHYMLLVAFLKDKHRQNRRNLTMNKTHKRFVDNIR